MKNTLKKALKLFRGFWSFNTASQISRRDFWLTLAMVIIFSIGLCIGGYHFLDWLNQKAGFINTELGLSALFGLIFGFYLFVLWGNLIVFIIRRLKDAGLKKYWIYLTVLAELTPFFIVIFSDTSQSEIPLLFLIILLYMFPLSYFQLPMFLPLLLCLLPSKAKEKISPK